MISKNFPSFKSFIKRADSLAYRLPALIEGLTGAGAGAGLGALSALHKPKGERAEAAKHRALVGAGVGGALGVGVGKGLRHLGGAENRALWEEVQAARQNLDHDLRAAKFTEDLTEAHVRSAAERSARTPNNPIRESKGVVFPQPSAVERRIRTGGFTGAGPAGREYGGPPAVGPFGLGLGRAESHVVGSKPGDTYPGGWWKDMAKQDLATMREPYDPVTEGHTLRWTPERGVQRISGQWKTHD